jgi:hypothetical protein
MKQLVTSPYGGIRLYPDSRSREIAITMLAKRGYTYFTRFAYPILYVALSYGKECAGYGQAVAEQGEGIR